MGDDLTGLDGRPNEISKAEACAETPGKTGLHSMIGTILRFLLYITNNQARSRHEEIFDMFFWLVETLAVVIGVWILLAKHGSEWIPFLVIEYCWAMDNLRHNRP
jgi:hypothetical protein